MGKTFVTADGEHGFWMRDLTLGLWLRLLALHVPEPDNFTPPEMRAAAKRIRDQWLLASGGGFMGCIPCGMRDAVTTDAGVATVRSAIGSLLQALERAPKQLDQGVINLLGFADGFQWQDFETWRLIEVGHAFLGLVDGKIRATCASIEFMPGTRSEAGVNQKLRGWTARHRRP